MSDLYGKPRKVNTGPDKAKTVGKRIAKILIFTIVLSLVSPFQNASAGFYDWLKSKADQTELLTKIVEENRNSSDKFQAWTKSLENNNAKESEQEYKIIKKYQVRATGYSSTPDQTDSTPFITASGTTVRDGIVAANFLPFGTKVRIPDVYGDKIFTVEDRMNKRYWMNIDIWFPERNHALTFGSKHLTIEIVEES